MRGAWVEITMWSSRWKSAQSLPVRGAWVEIFSGLRPAVRPVVAPRAGSVG